MRRQTPKRNQLFKYIQPPPAHHSRSLSELAQLPQPAQPRYGNTKANNKENHHSSLCQEGREIEQVKSQSLKKFLSMFGTSNNPVLQASSTSRKGEEKPLSARPSNPNRQVFTCNIKNMNVNMAGSREKDHPQHHSLALKKEKADKHGATQREGEELQLVRKELEACKQREAVLVKQKSTLECQNVALRNEIKECTVQRQHFEEKSLFRQRELQRKIDSLQRAAQQERSREQDLVIESLKKVINEQLRKIIELEKFKVEREEIDRLEERMSKNMCGQEETAVGQMEMIKTAAVQMHKKGYSHIKIDDCQETPSSTPDDTPEESEVDGGDVCQPIEEANEAEEESGIGVSEGDSILDEVDRYLTQWRGSR